MVISCRKTKHVQASWCLPEIATGAERPRNDKEATPVCHCEEQRDVAIYFLPIMSIVGSAVMRR